MKRKVVKQGPATLMVSLPSKWVKKYNIKKGDELEINEDSGKLVLGKEITLGVQQNSIDVSGQDTMIHRIIGAVYKAGYDDLIIKYSNSEELKIIQDRLDLNLVEFDIAEYKENSVRVKSVSKLDTGQFDIVYKKVFFILKDITRDILTAVSKNDYETLKSITMRDKSLDKYADYCRRLLNKRVETKFNKPKPIYSLIEEIEIIGDMYKDICTEIAKNKIVLSKDIKSFFEEVNNFLISFCDLVFDFDLKKIREFGEERVRLNKIADSLIRKVDKKENKVLFILVQIFNTTFEMKSALLTGFV